LACSDRICCQQCRLFLEIQEEYGSFAKYIWYFVNNTPKLNRIKTLAGLSGDQPGADVMSKDLKKSGFKILGSTVYYSHMQATGMVNDHCIDCFRRSEIIASYKK
jgi:DNA-3-methyladenine glycosylase I